MLTFEERDDVTIQNPPADKVVLFYTDGALRLKDETGEVSTLATTEGLEAAAEATEPKVYVALLTQTDTNAPVATVLKNTLGGEVVWSYSVVGTYIGTLASAFTANKTIIITPYIRDYTAEPLLTILAERVSVNAIEVYTGTLNNVTGDEFIKFNTGNSILNATFIKIEVYP